MAGTFSIEIQDGSDNLPEKMLFPHDPAIASLSPSDHLARVQPHLKLCHRVLERDGHRCIDCGIALPGWMEIHHRDEDHDHFSMENLTAICHYCHLLHHPLQTGQFEYEPPLVLLRWPGIDQRVLQNLAWLILYLDNGNELVEEDVDSQRAFLHGVDYPAVVNYLKLVTSEIGTRRNRVGIWGDVTLASMLEYAVCKGEPGNWKDLRWFPAGVVEPKRQLGLLAIATPNMVPVPFLDREDTPEGGIYGNPLIHILQAALAEQSLIEKGRERTGQFVNAGETR